MPSLFNAPHDNDARLAQEAGLELDAIRAQLAAIGLSAKERALLAPLVPAFEAMADGFSQRFYDKFGAHAELAALLPNQARIDRLQATLRSYMRELLGAPVDMAYVLGRLRLGVVHQRIGLSPPWYLATCGHMLCEMLAPLAQTYPAGPQRQDAAVALVKSVLFDSGLALHGYGFRLEREIVEQHGDHPAAHAPPVSPAHEPAAAPEYARMKLDTALISSRADYIGITATDRATLAAMRPVVQAASGAVMDDFYQWFQSQPATAALVNAGALARLRHQVASYWDELTRADFGTSYAASRVRVGVIHERIGLTPEWYVAGLARQMEGFIRAVGVAGETGGGMEPLMALVKAVFFDLSFVLDAYMEARIRELLRTEQYAARLVSDMTAGVVVINGAEEVISANRAVIDMLGRDPGLLYRRPASEVLPFPALSDMIAQSLADPARRVIEIVHHKARQYRLTVMVLEARAGHRNQRGILIEDVTDVLGLARDMGRQDAEVEAIIASTRAVVWAAQPECGTMVSLSRAVVDVLGHRDVALLGRGNAMEELVHPEDRALFRALVDGLAMGERREAEHRMARADGSVIWVRTITSLGRGAGDEPHVLGFTLDISELRAAQERQRQATALAQHMETITRLTGGLAHDFNNTLTVISANIQLALSRSQDPALRDLLERALQSAHLGASLNRRLMGYTRRTVEPWGLFDPNPRLADLAIVLERTLGEGITLALGLEQDAGAIVAAPAEFDSAILNLVINARDAMDAGAGGTITIASRRQGSMIEIAVHDEGHGMAPEVAAQAAQAFFSTKPGENGFGLGLFMVQDFVESAGGALAISSTPQRGTSVRLAFPRHPLHAAADQATGADSTCAASI